MKDHKKRLHVISLVREQMVTIFSEMGFSVELAPEMDTTWYNMDAVNIPKDHPARDMQDTFYINGVEDMVMRTHTSNGQVRRMETGELPIQIISPGKVFRNEATDATHEAQFHQIEGLMVDTNISLGHLKGTLLKFFEKFFGESVDIRFRPGYFPFVEPGVEVDLKYRGKWLEVLGAGMVHPNVLRNGGIDPEKYQGFAFGMGIDRVAMMKYGFDDIRLFYQGDLRLHTNLKEQTLDNRR